MSDTPHTSVDYDEYDCDAQQRRLIKPGVDAKFDRIILGSNGEMILRALCARSTKF